MADYEEPPSKVTKVELGPSSLASVEEGLDEGQEEWLSEGVLTDDDYNIAAEHEQSDSNHGNTSQEDVTMASADNSADHQEPVEKDDTTQQTETENIEKTLDSLENSNVKNNNDSFPDDLDSFLVKKDENGKKQSNLDESVKNTDEEDDGHNTDELLRMLGEDNSKVPKTKALQSIKMKREQRHEDQESSDDDEYLFESAKVTRLKVAKNAVIRKAAIKAEPEDMSEGDSESMSSDEMSVMNNMFGVKRSNTSKASERSAAAGRAKMAERSKMADANKKFGQDKKQVTMKSTSGFKNFEQVPSSLSKSMGLKMSQDKKKIKPEPDEIIDEEEYLEDEMDLDEEYLQEFVEESDKAQTARRQLQRIMRPEEMDEEVPTDCESIEDADSMYDELPSSESEELEDWFTLDIRGERAGEYIPLLGESAHQLLSEEKRRMSSRLQNLRKSLSSLTESGRQRARQLRAAALALAQVDAALAAA